MVAIAGQTRLCGIAIMVHKAVWNCSHGTQGCVELLAWYTRLCGIARMVHKAVWNC